ncbi:MAG TPA: hypothetical protein VGO39_14120 [Gaiellaceae bacterium]|jgi:hypothetical protein|nr:hypothetical protein [Gaiellaceae bacterium]
MARALALIATLAAVLVTASDASGPVATLHFRVLAHTGIKLADVVWTGNGILYLENTTNTVWSAPAAGKPLTVFASMPRAVEETRCRVSPGTHGWAAGVIFCHAPDNTIYRITADGQSVTVFAKLPESSISDGALTFDTVGGFGYGLVAATGRSGAKTPSGGDVYAIDSSGSVRKVGHYTGPGGADEVEIAPVRFGAAARAALVSVDAGATGHLVAVTADGAARTIARFADGPNPVAAIVPTPIRGGTRAGLYLTDTLTTDAFFAPASDLRAYAGNVLVGSEIQGLFWVIRPRGRGYEAVRVPTTLRAGHYNLEGMAYVSP